MTPQAASSESALPPQTERGTVLKLDIPREEREETDHEMRADYLRGIRLLVDVLNARLLGLIAVLGGVGIWTYAVVEPALWPFIIGSGYSAGVVFPAIWLFSRKG